VTKTEKRKRAREVRHQLQLYINSLEPHVEEHITAVMRRDLGQYRADCLVIAARELSALLESP
jgi:hypothetical protein